MKTIVLTGASGFIGHASIPPLLARGYEIHAITSQKKIPETPGIHWHTFNLLDPVQVHDLIELVHPSHLMHFAWYTVPDKYWTARENIPWVQASVQLISEFVHAGGQRVVTAGTCAEYDWTYGYCSEFLTPVKPSTLYGVSKNTLHQLLQEILKGSDTISAWGRIFFLYGPNEHPSKLVSSIIRPLLQNEPAPCSTGTQIRDYLFIEDAAEAFVQLLDSDVSGPVNIASGIPVAIHDIIEMIGEKTGRADLIQYGALPGLSTDAPFVVADNRRLVQEVGWQQNYYLERGIEKTIDWWTKKHAGDEK